MDSNSRFILFDIGNVIVRSTHELTFACLHDMGVSNVAARRFYTDSLYREFSLGHALENEFCLSLRTVLNRNLSNAELRAAHDCHMYRVDQAVVAILKQLKCAGYPIGFATDTNPWQDRRQKELIDLARFSEIWFRSHLLGRFKADVGTFEYIADYLKTPPSSILLIDDSPEKIDRARQAGLATIQFVDAVALRLQLREMQII